MNLPFGTAITPAEVERLVSSWGDEGPGRLAVLCDAVAGWDAFRLGAVPLTTGRRSVKDGGIDIWIELTADQARHLPPASMVREGLNVLQVKSSSPTGRSTTRWSWCAGSPPAGARNCW